MALVLFAYAFVSNLAMAIVPHEPVVIWYGVHWGVWPTALVATAGTVAASVVDHRVFVPLVGRLAMQPVLTSGMVGKIRGLFSRAPFAGDRLPSRGFTRGHNSSGCLYAAFVLFPVR